PDRGAATGLGWRLGLDAGHGGVRLRAAVATPLVALVPVRLAVRIRAAHLVHPDPAADVVRALPVIGPAQPIRGAIRAARLGLRHAALRIDHSSLDERGGKVPLAV